MIRRYSGRFSTVRSTVEPLLGIHSGPEIIDVPRIVFALWENIGIGPSPPFDYRRHVPIERIRRAFSAVSGNSTYA